MKAHKKIERRLQARMEGWKTLTESRAHDAKVQNRIESGGYKKPGSRKKG